MDYGQTDGLAWHCLAVFLLICMDGKTELVRVQVQGKNETESGFWFSGLSLAMR